MTRILASLLVLVTCATAPIAQAPRIVAVGDVHGDFGAFVTVLTQAGVIDARRRWAGGSTILVQTGDVPDRGPESKKVMDLLMDLEKQAPRAGGQVHALLGNHEVMNMQGDLRFVTPGEFASYRTPDADVLRDAAYQANADPARREDPAYRTAWMDARPLGWVELLQAFSTQGKYGKWLRRHDTVVKVGDTLFLHGGISAKYVPLELKDINDRVRAGLGSPAAPEPLLTDPDGPLWYRGLALAPEAGLASHVDAVLARYGVTRIVVGHTVAPGVVLPRFGGKVILNDVGLSAVYGGPPSSLLIEGTAVSVRHRGTLVPLPTTADLTAYLDTVKALEPAESNLRTWLSQGGVWPPVTAPPPDGR